jgi:hypothetical protein
MSWLAVITPVDVEVKLDLPTYEDTPLPPDGALNCAVPLETDCEAPVLVYFVVHWLKLPLMKSSLKTVPLGGVVGVGVGEAVDVGVGVGVAVGFGVGVGVAVGVGVGLGVNVGVGFGVAVGFGVIVGVGVGVTVGIGVGVGEAVGLGVGVGELDPEILNFALSTCS